MCVCVHVCVRACVCVCNHVCVKTQRHTFTPHCLGQRRWATASNRSRHFNRTLVHVRRASRSCPTAPLAVHPAERGRPHPLPPCARPAVEIPCHLCLPATTVLRKYSPATLRPQVIQTATSQVFEESLEILRDLQSPHSPQGSSPAEILAGPHRVPHIPQRSSQSMDPCRSSRDPHSPQRSSHAEILAGPQEFLTFLRDPHSPQILTVLTDPWRSSESVPLRRQLAIKRVYQTVTYLD